MKFMKNILLLLSMIIMCSIFTSGLLSEGESFYEDFTSPSNDLNTSNWILVTRDSPTYSVSGGIATFTGGAVNDGSSRLVLHNLDKNVNPKLNSFSIEWRAKISNFAWGQKNFEISNDNDSWYGQTAQFGARVYSAGSSTDGFSSIEDINDSDTSTYLTSYGYSQLKMTYKTYKFIKTDDNLEFILDGVSQYNQTLEHIWNQDNNAIQDDMNYYSFYAGQHNWVSYYIDWINITNLGASGYSPINIEVISPANETITNTKPNVVFNSTGINGTLNCSLYLNDVLSLTNETVSLNTSTEFYLDLDVGDNNYYINCTDGINMGTSGEFSIWYDPNDPYINLESPLPFNTTVYDEYSMDVVGNITNEELDYIVVRLYDNNDILFYENITTSFIDSTIFPFDWTFETNATSNGVWDMYVYGNDTASNENELYLSFTVDNCIPDWSCSGYGTCNESDLAICTGVTDLNSCSMNYTGNYSGFLPQECNYCSIDLTELNRTDCINDWQIVGYEDLNFASCCNITGLAFDCMFGNESIGFLNQTCSIFDYSDEDIAKATINTFMKFILGISAFITMYIFVILFIWGYPKITGKK